MDRVTALDLGAVPARQGFTMDEFQIVVSPDILGALRHEHRQIRQLCTSVQGARRDQITGVLVALQRAFHAHLIGETAVVHPAVRNSGRPGDTIALACQTQGARLDRSLTELVRLGAGAPDFDDRFAALSEALRDHATRQERDEFPLLRRYVPVQRLHMMASAMTDVQIMALG